MVNLSQYGSIFSQLYTDKMEIYRHKNADNLDGTTATILPEKPLYSNISCRISFVNIDLANDLAVNKLPIRIIPKVFCATDVDIKSGDYIIITRNNIVQYKGIVGKPNVYESHQEISLSVKGDA